MNPTTIQTAFGCTSVLIVIVAISRPHLLLRPSFAFACLQSAIISPAAAFIMESSYVHSPDFDASYPDSPLFDTFRFLTVLFPLAVVAWVAVTPRLSETARTLWQSCQNSRLNVEPRPKIERILLWTCLLICGIVGAWYFATVSLKSTGLVALLSKSELANQRREESLAMLDSTLLRYVYSMTRAVIVPLAITLMILQGGRWRPLPILAKTIVCILLTIFVGITGARMPVAYVVITVTLAIVLVSSARRSMAIASLALLGIVIILGTATFLRSEHGFQGLMKSGTLMAQGLHHRIFVMPFETGLRSVQFASEQGFLGGANIRPYALLTGVPYVNLPSEVYSGYYYPYFIQHYPPDKVITSGTANTCFLFDFQAAMGLWWGWGLGLAAIGSLDFALLAFRRLRGIVLPAILAVFLPISTLKLLSSGYTTQLVTGGIALTILIALLASLLRRTMESPRSPTTTTTA